MADLAVKCWRAAGIGHWGKGGLNCAGLCSGATENPGKVRCSQPQIPWGRARDLRSVLCPAPSDFAAAAPPRRLRAAVVEEVATADGEQTTKSLDGEVSQLLETFYLRQTNMLGCLTEGSENDFRVAESITPLSFALAPVNATGSTGPLPLIERVPDMTHVSEPADAGATSQPFWDGAGDVGPSDASAAHQVSLAVMQSETPPKAERQDDLGNDYHVNVGYAIRTLREELPTMFYKEMSYDIYRDDITFQDPLNIFHGKKSYQTIFWALRFHGRIFFKALWVDVNRVWQPNDRTITIRWSVRGVPRVPWEAFGRFDGTSEYKLDKDGKIYAHKVDNIAFSDPPKYRARTVVELLQLSGVQQTPGITCFDNGAAPVLVGENPGLDLAGLHHRSGISRGAMGQRPLAMQVSHLAEGGALDPSPLLLRVEMGSVSWFRFYLALTGTLALRDDFEFAARALLLA